MKRFVLAALVLLQGAVTPLYAATAAPAKPAKARPPATAASAPNASTAQAEGYRIAPMPAWVVAPPAGAAPAAAPSGKGRVDELMDTQIRVEGSATQTFVRWRSAALDASALQRLAEAQLHFNPSFQKLVLHHVSVRRDGRVAQRLGQIRVETMRREQRLEQGLLDGTRTLLLPIPDVRVGDAIEVAYTLEGENPIFGAQFSTLVQGAGDAPIELLHVRIDAPAAMPLQFRRVGQLAGPELMPQRSEQAGRQIWTLQRRQVAAVPEEDGVPPWVKIFPAVHVSSWRDWAEVDAWAQQLFKPDPQPDAALKALAAQWQQQHAEPAARVAAALRFVQDEVRYLSLALGESSHRPKPAARTLAERFGDCKDKVLLFHQLLALMDVPAQPVLVSTRRNRGLLDYLPGHDQLDHVISRVTLDGRSWWLDPTLRGQGIALAQRGTMDYGAGLVVGTGQAPQRLQVDEPAEPMVRWAHRWDLSRRGEPARLEVEMRATGLAAEQWRAALEQAGEAVVLERQEGDYLRVLPGLQRTAPPQVEDDRQANLLRITQRFEHPAPAPYQNGGLRLDAVAFELFGLMNPPPEAKRQFSFLLNQPLRTTHEIEVLAPRALGKQRPPPRVVEGPGLRLSQQIQVDETRVRLTQQVERRSVELQPAELDSYRDTLQRARQALGMVLPLALIDSATLRGLLQVSEKSLAGVLSNPPDQLSRIVFEQEVKRVVSSEALKTLGETSPQALGALEERAVAHNMLGETEAALADAERALKLKPASPLALEVKGAALIGLGRPGEGLVPLQQLKEQGGGDDALGWLVIGLYQHGRYADAEREAQALAQRAQGEGREFALLWLYLAAERQSKGRGVEALRTAATAAPGSGDSSEESWGRSLRRFLAGELDQQALLKQAAADDKQRRLRQAEAHFFIGAQLVARGEAAAARPWFQRTLDSRALPYREHTLARLALRP